MSAPATVRSSCFARRTSATPRLWPKSEALRSPIPNQETTLRRQDRAKRDSYPPHTVSHSGRVSRSKNRIQDESPVQPSSYCFFSSFVAFLALINRSRPPRSVCTTTSIRSRPDVPIVTYRTSRPEWSGSGIVIESASPNTDVASSNETPCFNAFVFALFGSHSKITVTVRPVRPS
jgi:hypothetical protein